MEQVLQEMVNVFHLEVEDEEIEKVLDWWNPQVNDNLLFVRGNPVAIIESINETGESVTIRTNEGELFTLSVEDVKDSYVPLLTSLQAEELIEVLPPEYEGLREKLTNALSEQE
ncbi:hypothetical protein CVD28_24560 [Bacillus sp. M6-12]|uniref:hypothetical protein n=1 Tax=Bacillus sp. M6-12 TaxID=2054166 RepID=UPI000C761F3F|nr:hypothetical protein [Bacillus sp. M6-12]PLS15055.1 hypothetical protein CVD28_24560 [Bacillus sp. M6-12]